MVWVQATIAKHNLEKLVYALKLFSSNNEIEFCEFLGNMLGRLNNPSNSTVCLKDISLQ
jgi:hypothetical protein